MAEEQIYKIAFSIHQKYANRDIPHSGHDIWLLSGDCLKQLINPFNQHPLAAQLTQYMVDYFSNQYRSA